jgi:hypothetical protein
MVHEAIERAAISSDSESLFDSHLISTAYAIQTIVICAFNSISYLGYGIVEVVEAAVSLRDWEVLDAAKMAVTGSLQSIALLVVCVVIVPFGLLFPRLVFLPFAPVKTPLVNPPPAALNHINTIDPRIVPIAEPFKPPIPAVRPAPLPVHTSYVPIKPQPPIVKPQPSSPSVVHIVVPPVSTPRSEPVAVVVPSPAPRSVLNAPVAPRPDALIPSPSQHVVQKKKSDANDPVVRWDLSPLLLQETEVDKIIRMLQRIQSAPPQSSNALVRGPAQGVRRIGEIVLTQNNRIQVDLSQVSLQSIHNLLNQRPPRSETTCSSGGLAAVSSYPFPPVAFSICGQSLDSSGIGLQAQQILRAEMHRSFSMRAMQQQGLRALPAPDNMIDDFVGVTPSDVREIPKGNFLDYVAQFCPGYENTFDDLVKKGSLLNDQFRRTKPSDAGSPENTIPKDQRRALASSFVWYLMSVAQIEQGKGFGEGMFVFEDSDYRIHDFFAAVATARASSHYKGVRQTSYGLDIVQDNQSGLPAGHQTVHFGKLTTPDANRQYTFLKPESWGTESLWQMIGHGISYLLTRPAHLLGSASHQGEFKEHFPAELKREFLALLKAIGAPPEKDANWTVARTATTLTTFLTANPLTTHKKAIWEFLNSNIRYYESTLIRNGEEVILTLGQRESLNRPFIGLCKLLEPFSLPASRPLPRSVGDQKDPIS